MCIRHVRALALAVLAGAALFIARPRATNGTWTIMPALPTQTQEVSVIAMNNLVYVAAGSAFQVRTNALWSFDPSTNAWTSLAPYPGTPRDHVGIVAAGGFIYLIGGVTSWPQPSVTNFDRYDPATNTWASMAPLPVARGATGVAVIDGKIYAAGGLEAAVSVKDFTVYDPASNSWLALPNMPTARDHLTAAALDGKFYAIGGRINGQTCAPMNIVEIYDPVANTWTTGTPMLNARAGHATGTANGHIQVFGGEGNSIDCGTIAASEDFDPATNTWTTLPNMPTPRHGTGGGTIGSSVYIPGGGTWTADQPTGQHERFDANGTPPPALPAPWQNQDVGPVGIAGDASFSGSTLTVHASGADVWNQVDSFHYVYQQASGDVQIVARVASFTNTNPDAKVGVMMRESLTTGSRNVFVEVSPGGINMNARTTGGQATSVFGNVAGQNAPVWVKLARVGTTFTGSWSTDGVSWSTVGTMTMSAMNATTIGLATTSHNNSATTTAVYDSIAVGAPSGGGPPPPGPLPAPWTSQDVGAVGQAGSAGFTSSTSTFTVTAAGSDIWGTADSFRYTSQPLSGDGTIVVRITGLGNTNSFAKAGVMIRETTTAGSAHVLLDMRPGGPLEFMARTATGASTTFLGTGTQAPPAWLKLTRSGNSFQAFSSSDGSVWASIGTVTVTMAASVNIGIAVTSHTTTATTTATFDNVTVTASAPPPPPPPPPPGLPSPWTDQDVGAVGAAGNATYSSGVFTVNGSGSDIWGTADSFNIVSQPVSGDGSLVVRVATVQNTNAFAKAGVMWRETLTAGSAHVILDVRPNGSIEFMTRSSTGGSTTFIASTTDLPPAWLKLARTGSNIVGSVSADGTAWTQVGTTPVTMGANANVGFVVTSHAAGTLNQSTFDNVTFTSATPPPPPPPPPSPLPAPWATQDVGAVGVAGDAGYTSGVFTLKGAGSDIWGTTDAFRFVYQPLSGNGEVIARVTGMQNTNTYAKAGVMIRETTGVSAANALVDLRPQGTIEFLARSATGSSTAFIASATHPAPAWIKLSRSGPTIVASLSNDGLTWTQIGAASVTMNASVLVGLAVTSHDTTQLNQATFDNVSVTTSSGGPPPISFLTKALIVNGPSAGTGFGITNFTGPTSLAVGPDGRLYVSTVNGRIFIATMNRATLTDPNAVTVTSVQEIDDIYQKQSTICNVGGNINSCQPGPVPGQGRQVTGFTFGTDSTPTHIVLYVSHSGMGAASIDPSLDQRGGVITRLILEPNTTTPDPNDFSVIDNQDLVVGIPRSIEAHAPNGVAIGPDGWLYLTNGGNTNAGQRSHFFGDIDELYLSAAVLRLNLGNLTGTTLPIDVHSVNGPSDMTPFAGKFEMYATGYRNGYDLVWHSNGKLYLNGNAANQSQGNTPSATDGCSTPSISPGDELDQLNLVTQGAFGGHPNPVRHQCVWGDGSVYGPPNGPAPLSPEPNYVRPMWRYINGNSSDGIAEYTSNAFGGQMLGNLITATYAGDFSVKRVVLSADGLSVVQVVNLGQFARPLDVTTETSGLIYVAEYEGNRISLMIPQSLGACPVPGSDPAVTDSDGDGFTDADETSNGTDVCSASSRPPDWDSDRVSDLNDTDDDNDGIPDITDQLFLDASNGAATTLPVDFEWDPASPAAGGLASSGFWGTQISSNAPRDPATGHALRRSAIHAGDAGGHMNLETDSGTNEGMTNTQMNALQIGFDSSSNFEVLARVTQPFAGTTPAVGHVGGIFFGPDEDNYARIAIVGTAAGTPALTFAVEQNGVFTEVQRLDLGTTALSNVDIYLVGNVTSHTIQPFYVINTGSPVTWGTAVSVPGTWFSNSVGVNANRSLAGVVVSHGTAGAAPMAFGYDFFKIDRNSPAGPPPPPPGPTNIVVYAADIPAAQVHGSWTLVTDTTAAAGSKLSTPDVNFNSNTAPQASPTHYFDVTFNADSGVPYTLWLRSQATANSIKNDSLWVQFSDALASGTPIYPMNSTQGLLVNLATDGTGSSLNGWGWDHGAYWLSQPTTLTFAASGLHTMRVQVREDGVQIDQIVLSPTTYLNAAPGPPTADSTIVPKPGP